MPTKKRRLSNAAYSSVTADSTDVVITDDDAMPGFYEHEAGQGWQEVEGAETIIDLTRPENKLEYPEASMINNPAITVGELEVQSNPPAPDPSSLQCPICMKDLEVDNLGLNAHIDFCLSKDVIKEATKNSGASSKKVLAWSEDKRRPHRKGKRK